MTPAITTRFIDSLAALRRFCTELGRPEWVALDTEFLRERTYFPKFCLLQVASGDCVACIDPLAVDDLSPLDPLLDDRGVLKIFHAGRQDLEILYRRRGRLPLPLFDTQLAAPYVGLPEQMGYAALAAELLGAHLDKGHTRTDWSARPLSEAQLRYATDDVVYLGRIYECLSERLEGMDRRTWADEEMSNLMNPRLYDPDPQDAWLRIAGSTQFDSAETTLLQALAAWRETIARTHDCPRSWIVKDDALLEMTQRRPRDAAALKRLRNIDERTLKRYGAELLTIVLESGTGPPGRPRDRSRPVAENPTREALLDVFSALLQLKGAELSLNPALIASRRELREFIAAPEGSRLLQGWREIVAGRELQAVLDGRKGLRVVDGVLRSYDDVPR